MKDPVQQGSRGVSDGLAVHSARQSEHNGAAIVERRPASPRVRLGLAGRDLTVMSRHVTGARAPQSQHR